MASNVLFIHGMFQKPKSGEAWESYVTARAFHGVAPAWPCRDGEPAAQRATPPRGLGERHLEVVIDAIKEAAAPLADDLILVCLQTQCPDRQPISPLAV